VFHDAGTGTARRYAKAQAPDDWTVVTMDELGIKIVFEGARGEVGDGRLELSFLNRRVRP
jgi:hypothetical protein